MFTRPLGLRKVTRFSLLLVFTLNEVKTSDNELFLLITKPLEPGPTVSSTSSGRIAAGTLVLTRSAQDFGTAFDCGNGSFGGSSGISSAFDTGFVISRA